MNDASKPNNQRGSKEAGSPDSTATSLEALHLSASLSLISQRLSDLETRLSKKDSEKSATSKTWLELIKLLLGGWPAFGLLVMLLFYAPIRDAINVVPEKVRSANEIGVMGVSLKGSIKAEAERIGALQLSETLPSLSPAAIEFLFRGSRDQNSLVSYSLDDKDPNLISAIFLPSDTTLKILSELEAKDLIRIRLSSEDESVAALRNSIAQFKGQYPMIDSAGLSDSERARYELRKPTKIKPPYYSWRSTDLGKNAVAIILKAVSAQLAPSADRQGAPKSMTKSGA